MKPTDLSRRIALLFSGVAVVGMAVAGCSKDKDKPSEPSETPKTSGAPSPSAGSPTPQPSGPPASPTEKAPTLAPGGPNSFTPSVLAPPAPTALPGNVVTGG